MPYEDMGTDAQDFLYQSGFQSGQASSRRAADQGKPPPTELSEGDVLEVFSNTAGGWVPGRVANVSPDCVLVEWTIDGRVHVKKLKRQSEYIRLNGHMKQPLVDVSQNIHTILEEAEKLQHSQPHE